MDALATSTYMLTYHGKIQNFEFVNPIFAQITMAKTCI